MTQIETYIIFLATFVLGFMAGSWLVIKSYKEKLKRLLIRIPTGYPYDSENSESSYLMNEIINLKISIEEELK